ncbi:MAG: hypothetical protein ACE5R4_02770 [Armatimonadota bacterium]
MSGWSRQAGLVLALLGVCLAGCGHRRGATVVPPPEEAPAQAAQLGADELKRRLAQNLEEARAACEQYGALCGHAEALVDRQDRQELAEETVPALTTIAEEAQMVLVRLDRLAREQDSLARQVLRSQGAARE